MILENTFTVTVPMDSLFDALVDGDTVAGCIPDASLTGIEGGTAKGRLRLHVAGSTITYRGELRGVEADREAGALGFAVEAREIRGDGVLRGSVAMRLRGSQGSTTASLHGDVEATGRAAAAGDERMRAAVQRLLDDLAARLTRRLDTAATETVAADAGTAPPPPAGVAVEAPPPPPPPAPAPVVAGTVRVMTTEPLDAATVPTSDDWLPRLRDLVRDRPWLVPLVLLVAVVLVLRLRRRD